MLTITVPACNREDWDEINNEFVYVNFPEKTIALEHSLVSLSKWEAKWEKPFLGKQDKTKEEALDYVRCMTITQNIDPIIYAHLGSDNIEKINRYIDAKMTATVITDRRPNRPNRETYTSELLYYYMIVYGIPFECQKWHLNRLLTLISICNIKNQSDNKMTQKETIARNKEINEMNRKKYKSKG